MVRNSLFGKQGSCQVFVYITFLIVKDSYLNHFFYEQNPCFSCLYDVHLVSNLKLTLQFVQTYL